METSSWRQSRPEARIAKKQDVEQNRLGPDGLQLGIANIPVAWINTRYRMVYLNYGHGDQIYSTPVLPMMIDNCLRWLLSR